MNRTDRETSAGADSELAGSLRKVILLGAAILVIALPPTVFFNLFPKAPAALTAGAPQTAVSEQPKQRRTSPASAVRLAQFGGEEASLQVRQMANWVMDSQDHRSMSFVIIDKSAAKVFLFDPAGSLKAAAPALLGEAIGDDTAPGIGDKPLSQVLPEEKTTPAGRFVAEVGMSTRGEDVVWVDYDAAVSMHRVLKVEQRIQRLGSPTPEDNRMSFGCINLPPQFYERALRPAVDAGAVIYILPETRPLRATFAGFYEVGSPVKLAGAAR